MLTEQLFLGSAPEKEESPASCNVLVEYIGLPVVNRCRLHGMK
jgi:hypothetical protein